MRLRSTSVVLLALFAGTACGAGTPQPEAALATPSTVSPAVVAPAPAPAAPSAPAPDPSLGQLDFAITGAPECQRAFREGMLALHSFLYDQAHESFAAALAADPGCAMAAWGDAMTYDHPVWSERDVVKGRAALARVSHEDALTPKERAYIEVARALYAKDGAQEGHEAWLSSAAAMHREYPDDDEVHLQHALALLSVYGYDPKHVREQMEAGAIALSVLARKPEHPGAAHYVIHAMDSREHAILALPAARTYARIAPAAGHAQHMPSHTFTHLGMWREVVPSNERAYASSVAWEKAHGHTPSKYDWHSYSWLVAAHLELGQHARARALLDDARALLIDAKDDSADFRYDYASMVAAYVTQSERWAEAEALVAPVLAPAFAEGSGGSGAVACAMHAPGGSADFRMPTALSARMTANVLRAEAAIHLGDAAAVEKRVADLRTVRGQMAAWSKALPPDFAKRWEVVEGALLARGRAGAKPSAEASKKVIAALERLDQIDRTRSNAGPAWLKTTRETLGEAQLAAGKPKDAWATFVLDLDARPNRAIALLGSARAAKAAGEGAKARDAYATLAELWRDADADLSALPEVRAGAK